MTTRRIAALLFFVFAVQEAVTPEPLKSGLDLAALDRSVRPQDDLYRFANGAWLQRSEIPPDRVSYGTFPELTDRTELQLREIIESLAGRNATERKIRDFYTSVMDERRIEEIGLATVQPVLQRIDAIDSVKALATECGRLSSGGGGGPFQTSAGVDARDPRRIIVQVTQGGTLLPDRQYYLNPDRGSASIRNAYVAYLTTLYSVTGRAEPEADAANVLELETALAQAQAPLAGSRVSLAQAEGFSLRDLHARMPGFDWTAWARPQGLDRASVIILGQPDFFSAFAKRVEDVPLRTWKAWLAARYLTAISPFSIRVLHEARFEFFGRVLTGQVAPRARWKQAVSLVSVHMGDAVGRLYVEKHFRPASRERIEKLVGNLLEAYRDAVKQADWMTPSTRRYALGKLDRLETRIGHPERWRDYSQLDVRPNDLMGNVERVQKFDNAYQARRLALRTEPDQWIVTPQTVNATYLPWRNEIILPAAMLQPPLFDPDADDAVNYGALGAVVGHEIGHAFDQQGRRYDGSGVAFDWWTSADDEKFLQRAQMLVEQFSGYDAGFNQRVNGHVTLGENIGDLAGLAVAVRAYRISLQKKEAPLIDGFTGEQRLFVRWAQLWRTLMRDEYLRQTMLINHHAPAEHRANGAAVNLDAFYSAFSVQPGDKLFVEPKKRVRIW
jgi:putative endopeptidase